MTTRPPRNRPNRSLPALARFGADRLKRAIERYWTFSEPTAAQPSAETLRESMAILVIDALAGVDAAIQAIIDKEAKKRREAITEYEKAGRDDLAQKEREELAVLAEFLPTQLTEAELSEIISATIAELGASGAKDMGRVMGTLRPKIAGKADGKLASEIVKSQLS